MSAFIVFEGGDGSGKTTHSRRLASALNRSGYSVVSTREPGGGPLGDAVRRWVKGRRDLSAEAELMLFMAARAQHVTDLIRPALQSGTVVLCDRFTASSVAYQGYGRGIDLDTVHRLNGLACGDVSPDLTVLLDLPPEVGLSRRADQPDTFESEALDFHRRVREGYLEQAAKNPKGWLAVDASASKEAVAEEVWEKVQALLQSRS